jgi:hypothetical protein
MHKEKLSNLARHIGVSAHHLNSEKKILIREIQRTLGQEPCYLTDLRYSCNETCDWSDGCKKLTAAWLR